MAHSIWLWIETVALVILVVREVLRRIPVPVFDHNSATLMCSSKNTQGLIARALSLAIGKPSVRLDTTQVDRYMFRDGTSIDYLRYDPKLMYRVVALKSIVLPIWSRHNPEDIANKIASCLSSRGGYQCQVVLTPDSAFPPGDTVLLLSGAFAKPGSAGFGLIIRKHAFRIRGAKPVPFKNFSGQ
jgi:hypothetical protein